MKVCFVCWRLGVGSAEVRGRQIAERLGGDVVSLGEFSADVAAGYDVVVYVKKLPKPAVMEAVRRRGIRQVADPVDNYDWGHLRRRREWIDAFIGSNLTHAVHLERLTGRPAHAIPHHHCNREGHRIPAGRTPPTLGFVGGRDYLPTNRRLVKRTRHAAVFDTAFRELDRTYLGLDIGFAWRDEPEKNSFNSALKLVNFMSYGIPSVLTPETGYLEVARHGESCLFAQTKGEFVMLLDHLAEDAELRRRMGEAAYEAARAYHIDRVVEHYRTFLNEL